MPCNAFVALPALVLLGYGWFIRINYWPYLDAQLQFISPDLAGLPEDVIGFGFWMWWPFIALLFTFALTSALSGVPITRYTGAKVRSERATSVISTGEPRVGHLNIVGVSLIRYEDMINEVVGH